ncbi:hypothetical protein ACFQ7J_19815 [Streptomyces sp. NPDC056501]|uniref:hypothetical protein n=1 Tax=Streptomyces sp. NPDC056501 TaxID=3345841 RepID=UPI0036B8E04E
MTDRRENGAESSPRRRGQGKLEAHVLSVLKGAVGPVTGAGGSSSAPACSPR